MDQQMALWDGWDLLKALGLVATLATSLGLVTSPKARRNLSTFATAAGVATALVHMVTPPRCPRCGTRQIPGNGGYTCPQCCE